MGRKLVDLTGQKFGRLTVVEYCGRVGHSSSWRCVCECGKETRSSGNGLRNGTAKSCGCFRSDRMSGLNYKHGERGGENRKRKPPEYKAWEAIKQRCTNPKAKGWEWYGGRGIAMAPEWVNDFPAFLSHVGPRPSPKHTIDRIDSNKDYAPGNVRWASWDVQANNRSNNRIVDIGGYRLTLKEAADAVGLPYKTVKGRIQKGWSVDDALSEPLDMDKVNAQRNPRKADDAT